MSLDDYVDLAGGYSKVAEDDETFVILPDAALARAHRASSASWSDPIPPGSTIVVPPNPAPFNTMVFLTQVSQIFGQVAIAAAGLSSVSHSNN